MKKNEQRTKNLTLRDIHVGDWVQCWIEPQKAYTGPVEVVEVRKGGVVCVVGGGGSLLQFDASRVDELPMTDKLAESFGFEYVTEYGAWVSPDGQLTFCDGHLYYCQNKLFGDCMSDLQEQLYNQGYDPKFELV